MKTLIAIATLLLLCGGCAATRSATSIEVEYDGIRPHVAVSSTVYH